MCLFNTHHCVFFFSTLRFRAKPKKQTNKKTKQCTGVLTKQELASDLRLLSQSSSGRAETKRTGDGLQQLCLVHSSHTKGWPTPRLNKRKTSLTYCVFTQRIPPCSTLVHKEKVPLMFFCLFSKSPRCPDVRTNYL